MMKKRREWRRRAIEAAACLVTWPTGKPGREKVEAEVNKTINKVREWFREPRSNQVISAVQRRAINTFRQQ